MVLPKKGPSSFFPKLLGFIFTFPPPPCSQPPWTRSARTAAAKKPEKREKNGDFWPHPRFFQTVTARLARPSAATAARAARATRRGWSDYILPPVTYMCLSLPLLFLFTVRRRHGRLWSQGRKLSLCPPCFGQPIRLMQVPVQKRLLKMNF